MNAIRLSVRENVLTNPSSVTHEHYQRLLTGSGRGFVCEEEGGLVGFAIADLEASNVFALFVSPAHERRGIGRLLLDELVLALDVAPCRNRTPKSKFGKGPRWRTTTMEMNPATT